MKLGFMYFILVCLGRCFCTTDPCEDSIELHSISGRSPLSSTTIPCDAYITPRWYKTPRYEMITYNPGLNRCGSIFPIFLQGDLPNDTAIHSITACMVSPGGGCAENFIVWVKKCGADRAYYLSPPAICDSNYCFYASRNYTDEAPSWKPSSLSVHPDVDFDNNASFPTLYFTCGFNPSSETLLYKITWFVNSAKIKKTEFLSLSDLVHSGRLEQIDLTSNGYKLNVVISCGVVAVKSIQGEPGNYTHSTGFYAGIRVLNQTISIEAGGQADIFLKPTIPIPCPIYIQQPHCYYDIWMFNTYDEFECKGKNIGSNRKCGVKMTGAKQTDTIWFNERRWDEEIPMLIRHRMEAVYDNQRVYTLQLRVANNYFNDILKGTMLDEVRVNVIPKETQMWKDKLCYGIADPHLRTFDGNYYEMHMPGEYMMYRHTTLNITVQAKTTTCWGAYCFCGIIVNAGRDVFMIYVCPDYRVKYDRFILCEDGLLTASSKGGSEYEVFLSTGTIVKVMIIESHFINIYIYPSVQDKGKTEGLCGSFDENPKNDFTLRNGGYQAGKFNYPTSPDSPYTYVNDFSNSWKLKASENLFPHAGFVAKYKSLSPMPNRVQFCHCESMNGENQPMLHPVATCDYREFADCTDKRARPLICNHYQSKSNPETMSDQFDFLNGNTHVRKKKSTVMPYTEAEAYHLCSQGFQDSPIIQLCSGSDLIDNSSLSLCVTDLMLTGDDSWIYHQIESARMQCVHAVEFNETLQREFANLTDAIKSLNCQNNCSGEGSCINGTCICKDGFEETDCSVNKAEPPEILSTSHRVVHHATHKYSCDRSTKHCQLIDLFGQGFVYDPPPMLRIKKYKITTTFTTDLMKQYTIPCTWRGRFEVTCTLDRESLPPDVFVTQYKFEISNDGINFGSEMSLHVFHATCQEIGHGTGGITYKLKDNFCYIKDVCYAHKATEISKTCSICNSAEDKFKWSKSKEDDCLTKSTSEETSNSLTIGLSVGGSILFVVVVVVVLKCCKTKYCRSNVLTCTPSKAYDNYSNETLFTKWTSSQVSMFSVETSSDSTPASTNTTNQSKDFFVRPSSAASANSIQLFDETLISSPPMASQMELMTKSYRR